jgi:hypothetical protein
VSSRTGQHVALDRTLEVLTVLILGMATVGSAWCAFQSSRWSGVETQEARASGQARIEASRSFALGTQALSYDAVMAAQYANALADGNTGLQQFYLDGLIRPEFMPIIEEWQRQVAAGEVPTQILDNTEYIDSQFAASRELDDEAEAAVTRSEVAAQYADRYVMNTIFMAMALFFAGITGSFRSLFVRVVLVAAAAVVVAVGAGQIVDLPIATSVVPG